MRLLTFFCTASAVAFAASSVPARTTPNASGFATTVSTNGPIDESNPFFQSALGTNGRACVTCHQPDQGWSIAPAALKKLFDATGGLDPVFRTNDGSNSPNADVSTIAARRSAYSMLLNRGVIRVGIGVPANAEFALVGVDDPYGYASAAELSLFRRPLPGTNVRFLSAIMWDARNTFQPVTDAATLQYDLMQQAKGAIEGHAAGIAPSDAVLEQIVHFVFGLHTAQTWDSDAGSLLARGALGGPETLVNQEFYIGINDPLGSGPFDSSAMRLYDKWAHLNGATNDPNDIGDAQNRNAAREAVARGERIFNTRSFAITGVGGLNDALGVSSLQGTCTTCHNSPNVGNHSVAMALNIGIADASRRKPEVPLYTLENKTTGQVVKTLDPGRALITGKWSDIGKFKGPVLRALAARPPYFHDGSAASLEEVVAFYDQRFNIGLSAQEKADLVAFLRTL